MVIIMPFSPADVATLTTNYNENYSYHHQTVMYYTDA